jgi:hypothetical protein
MAATEEVEQVQTVDGVKVRFECVPVPVDQTDQVREGASPAGRYPMFSSFWIFVGRRSVT